MERCMATYSPMVKCLLLWLLRPCIVVTAGAFLAQLGLPWSQAGDGSALVARVNGSPITYPQLMRAVRAKLPMVSYHKRVSADKWAEIEQAALEALIDRELLAQEAKRRGLHVPESQVNSRLEKMKGRFAEATLAQLKQDIEKELMASELLQAEVDAKVSVTEAEVRNYFRANRDKFIRPESVYLWHILIRVDPGGGPTAWQQGGEQAARIFRRLKEGADFAELAKLHSQDPSSRDRGGELGWVHRGRLIPTLERVAFSLPSGEVGGPVRTIYGFHVLKVVGKQPERQLEYAEIDQGLLRKHLLRKARERRQAELIAALRARARIEMLGTPPELR